MENETPKDQRLSIIIIGIDRFAHEITSGEIFLRRTADTNAEEIEVVYGSYDHWLAQSSLVSVRSQDPDHPDDPVQSLEIFYSSSVFCASDLSLRSGFVDSKIELLGDRVGDVIHSVTRAFRTWSSGLSIPLPADLAISWIDMETGRQIWNIVCVWFVLRSQLEPNAVHRSTFSYFRNIFRTFRSLIFT